MWKFTALFFLIMFMIGTDTFLIAPLLPTLQVQFDVSTEISGWMIGAYTLGSALFALIAGPLSDGWNRKVVMLGGLLSFSIMTILCGFADSFWMMCFFRFLAGVSAAFTAPQVWASIPVVIPASSVSKTMGIAFSGLAASQAFGVPIGSWLAVVHWGIPFWTIGVSSLLLLIFAFFTLPAIKPSLDQAKQGVILRRYVPLITSGQARTGFLAYFLLHLGCGTAFAFIGQWLADGFELPIAQIGLIMMFLGLGIFLGSMFSAYATQKLGHAKAVVVSMSILIILYTSTPFLINLPIATIIYLLIFAILGVIFPIIMELLVSLNASIRGTISSLANSTMNGANTLGAWLAGLLFVSFSGFSSIALFSAICLALSLATFLLGGLLGKKTRTSRVDSTTTP